MRSSLHELESPCRKVNYESALVQAIVLSMFTSLIMNSGGNSGSQATSLLIRGLALREVRFSDWWRVVSCEAPTELVLDAVLAGIAIVRMAV